MLSGISRQGREWRRPITSNKINTTGMTNTEGGEFIINKSSVDSYRNLLDDINTRKITEQFRERVRLRNNRFYLQYSQKEELV
jgi:hypothetical protein